MKKKVSVPKVVLDEAMYEGAGNITGAKSFGADYVLRTDIGFMAFAREIGYWKFLGTFQSSTEAEEELRVYGEEDEEE